MHMLGFNDNQIHKEAEEELTSVTLKVAKALQHFTTLRILDLGNNNNNNNLVVHHKLLVVCNNNIPQEACDEPLCK